MSVDSPSHDTAAPVAAGAAWTPLRHWRPQQLDAIAAHVAQASLDWSGAWTGSAGAAPEPARDALRAAAHVAERAHPAPLGLPLHAPGGHGGAARAWLGCAAGRGGLRAAHPVQVLRRILCGDAASGGPDSIAEELGHAALVELMGALRTALGLDGDDAAAAPAELPFADFHAWSGAVRVVLPVSGELVLYLNGACAQRLAPPAAAHAAPAAARAPLSPVAQAAGQHALRLQARLHDVDLTLGHLKSLAPGDVVVLPHALEEALVVVTEHGVPVCRAYLGRQHASRALELVRGQEPNGVPA